MSAAPSPSPRPSLSFRSPSSSSRTSFDLPTSDQNSLSRATTTRRNRAALREFYNIKASAPGDGTDTQSLTSPKGPGEHTALSELDREGFDAGTFVRRLLERDGLEGVLKVENELVGEIRGLDGDRKALVYDNYSKLISATDTIKKMRTNMDPLTPTTSTLAPAISHIAETAATLSNDLSAHMPVSRSQEALRQAKERRTVQWVLDAPERLGHLLDAGKMTDALEEWGIVKSLLEKWAGVDGVEDVLSSCERIMATDES